MKHWCLKFLLVIPITALLGCGGNSSDETSTPPAPLESTAVQEAALGPLPEPAQVYRGFSRPYPHLVHRVDPQYPEKCKEQGIKGTVILEIVVSDTGKVGDVHILRDLDCDGIDEAAIEAVKQWKFEPAMSEGKAMTSIMTLTMKFGVDKP